MQLSIFNLFNIGIGPSSSHTVGPMRAANFFIQKLKKHNFFDRCTKVQVELYGSLSFTGIGHGTDKAIFVGLEGEAPELTHPDRIETIICHIEQNKKINLGGEKELPFDPAHDLIFKDHALPYHSNGMIFYAYEGMELLYRKVFYSVGGGFIVGHKSAQNNQLQTDEVKVPFPFFTAQELLSLTEKHNLSIADICYQNELCHRSADRVEEKVQEIWKVMQDCMARGLRTEGVLPGRLSVRRRAKELHDNLISHPEEALKDPLTIIDWVNLYALAVNEENAAGGRVVTAPTNGAAGIVPAVLMYYVKFCRDSKRKDIDDIKRFFFTAGTIGLLYKINASISGAEVGCQGEVGVACSMAAAGLTEVLGGTPAQVENAAEIGMEHNLGLTCDPVQGQVQIPCIERNAMAAVKAINAARIALRGSGKHFISLDKVMKTMKDTGLDMQEKYKETSRGGLAVNVTEC